MNKTKALSKETINEMPLLRFKGPIHVCNNKKSVMRACKVLSRQSAIGFDTETKPAFRKGENNQVALLQLSTKNEAFLFRLKLCGLSGPIIKILEDENIVKAGVAIRDDIISLQELSSFKPKGFVEIANLAKERNIPERGLRGLAARALRGRISKGAKLSNWEGPKLTRAQLVYAATDAWCGLKLYQYFEEN